jgi:HEAT repeat protein
MELAMLRDLVGSDGDPLHWREILDMVVDRIGSLVRAGNLESAATLAEAIALQAADGPRPRRTSADEALAEVAHDDLIRRAVVHLRSSESSGAPAVKRLLGAFGPRIIDSLVSLWQGEHEARTRRMFQEIVLGFGARARDRAQRLIEAGDWEVRRTAVQLLRESGGGKSLAALAPLLNDADDRVRRDAFRALALDGDESACAAIQGALSTRSDAIRATLREETATLKDVRARPLLRYLIRHLDHRRAFRDELLALIELLGASGDGEAVDALRGALARSVWWPPGRSRAFHRQAARALSRIGTPAAVDTLAHIARTGQGSARAAAREALAAARPS